MNELLSRLDADLDPNPYWIRIVGADWFADDLRLDISLRTSDETEPELWEISCAGVYEESISSMGAETLLLSGNSLLLKPYKELEVDIAFSENRLVPEFLFGVLCSCCIEGLGRVERIAKFLRTTPNTLAIASSPYGMLGRFPSSIAEEILLRLEGQPIRANALPGTTPRRWKKSEFVEYPATISALEIGSSYVIAAAFSACRV